MRDISTLITSIIKEGKMTQDAVIKHLTEALEDCECGEKDVEYRRLYEEAFGKHITKELADSWVKSMDVPEGVDRADGQRWTSEQTADVASRLNVTFTDFTKIDWYCVMNMMYSDHYDSAKYVEKQNDPVYFAHLAKDWLCDSDAPSDKLYRYYFKVIS